MGILLRAGGMGLWGFGVVDGGRCVYMVSGSLVVCEYED